MIILSLKPLCMKHIKPAIAALLLLLFSSSFAQNSLKGKITKAHLLAAHSAKVEVNQSADRIILTLPQQAPDAIASVVCMDL